MIYLLLHEGAPSVAVAAHRYARSPTIYLIHYLVLHIILRTGGFCY